MQDEELALAGAATLANAAALQVTFFDSSQVKDAFAKGAVLFDHGERYMVHASKREAPGMAEIHNDDTDIVYVLDGTATLVTGGRAENLKTTAPGELRGSSIANGDERQLSAGDVIIIPAGVPHWFKQVSAPFHYYVVKAR
jgi:quercetin dioxygenase-like cupin family protein